MNSKIKLLSIPILLFLFINAQGMDQPIQQNCQLETLDEVQPVLRIVLQNSMKNAWHRNGKIIVDAALQAMIAVMATAALNLAYQAAQIETGNLDELNNTKTLIALLSSISRSAISTTHLHSRISPIKKTALIALESSALTEAFINPSVQKQEFHIAIPSIKGLVSSWIKSEIMEVIKITFEHDNEIIESIKNLDIKKIIFGKELTPTKYPLVAAALPQLQEIIKNEKLALMILETGFIVFQSALIGGLLHTTGLGYAGTTLTHSLHYAMLTAIAQSCIATIAALTHNSQPGAIVTIAAAPLGQYIFTIAGSTRQAAVTATIQAATTEVTNLLIDQAQQSGGLLKMLNKLKNTLNMRWENIWENITETFEALQEIKPVPL